METKVELQAMGFEPVPILKSVRAKCLDCSGGSHAEIVDCLVKNCALYPFRMGKNPWRAQASEAQREARRRTGQRAAARLRKPISGIGSATMDGMAATLPPAGDSMAAGS
jgi:hypothetical protein